MSKQQVFLLYLILVFTWSINWTVIKLVLETVPVFWTSVLRHGIAFVTLFILLIFLKKLSLPRKGDWLGIVVIGFFQMVLMGVFMNIGVSLTSVGRSSILMYSMPLWVTPIAYFYLREPIDKIQFFGVLLGLLGIAILFNPFAERTNPHEMWGSFCMLLSSLCGALTIIFIKKYEWRSSPLQLSVWQNLLATTVTMILASYSEGKPHFSLTPTLTGQLFYLGVLATALAFWLSTILSRYLPAVVNSLGLLAVPVVSMIISAIYLGESFDLALILATVCIIGGIVLGFLPSLKK